MLSQKHKVYSEASEFKFFFKESISNISKIDPADLMAVISYRQELAERGVYYGTFYNASDLAQAVRVGVQRAVNSVVKRQITIEQPPALQVQKCALREPFEESERGILDLIEISEISANEMTNEIDKMNAIMLSINEEAIKQTSEIDTLNSVNASTSERKTLINGFADFLAKAAQDILDGSSRARTLFKNLFEAQTELYSLMLGNMSNDEFTAARQPVKETYGTMLFNCIAARAGVIELRRTVENLPRITSQFNQARRRLLESLDENIEFMNDVERGVLELISDRSPSSGVSEVL